MNWPNSVLWARAKGYKVFEENGVLGSSVCKRRQHLLMICYYGFQAIKIRAADAGTPVIRNLLSWS